MHNDVGLNQQLQHSWKPDEQKIQPRTQKGEKCEQHFTVTLQATYH
jgi:hypothetical protein